MTSEELLGTLEELANNHGLVLDDWDEEDLVKLRELAGRLVDTLNELLPVNSGLEDMLDERRRAQERMDALWTPSKEAERSA